MPGTLVLSPGFSASSVRTRFGQDANARAACIVYISARAIRDLCLWIPIIFLKNAPGILVS